MNDHVAADDVRPLDADEIQGHALAALRTGGLVAVHLHGAHACFLAAGQDPHRLACGNPSGDRGPRDDDAVALHHERAVDGHAKRLVGARGGDTAEATADLGAKLLDPPPREGGDADRSARPRAPCRA